MLSRQPFVLSAIGVYVPETKVKVEQAIGWGRSSGIEFAGTGQAYADNGFRYVPVEEELDLEEMAKRVMAPAVRQAAESGTEIAAVLFASVTGEACVHRQAVLRAARGLGLGSAPVIQLGEYGCSTMHLALRIAERFFAGSRRDREALLVVTADKGGTPSERINRYMVFGDGACAALCTAALQPGGHWTYGAEVRADGIAYDDSPDRARRYFSTSYLGIRQVVKALLRRFPIPWSNIRAVYCTNLGLAQWSAVALAIGCPAEKIYAGTLAEYGHIHNVDILSSVERSLQTGDLLPGDYYMTLSVGFGGYYGCALHRYEPGGREEKR